ncbi:MAG: AI-2E family transporter [Bacilli bacterium]
MKKQLNYKVLNILMIIGIIYLLFLMKGIWIGVVKEIITIILPFAIAFIVAYILYPFLEFLTGKKVPKTLSILLILITLFIIFGLTLYFVVPVFFEQVVNLFSSLIELSTNIATKYGIDMAMFNSTINSYSQKIIQGIGTFISDGSLVGILSMSVNVLSKAIIILIVSIYFLADMKNIRSKVSQFLKTKSKKTAYMVSVLDHEIYSYLKGLGIFMIIQFFEYTFLFLIIGHPNFLLIGTLACVTTIIPYFGGMITNVIALIIASVISPKLFVLSLIITIVFPNIDGYVISPKIYGKTNQIPALLTIFAVTTGGVLYGFIGIVIALPITIIVVSLIKIYKTEINERIISIKEKI